MERNSWPIWALVVCGGIVALALIGNSLSSLDEVDGTRQLIYLLLLLSMVGGGALYRFRTETRTALSQLAIWVALLAGLTLAYSYKDDFATLGQRFAGTLDPRGGVATGEQSVSFTRASSGHYEVRASLDGVAITFYVDTGASAIVLTPQAAERLGYDLDKLAYNMMSETANGYGRSAPIRIDELVMGPIVMHDVPAHVNMTGMSHSLLGMEFLSRLKSLHIEGDTLTIEQ
ncbi:TIGR02281 family clan AA aspartic protease [Dongia sp.]|uniref:retropepsin-like aspartic protease family protein n=1 Tax=Dongia sp. TaxID=1977262 RepID=UPI0035B12B34